MNTKDYFFYKDIKGQYQKAIAPETAKALTLFCQQEPEFEQAIEQSGKSFQECLDSVCKGIKHSISDLEAYSKAVKFYFSTAEVHFNMQIDLCGNNGFEAPPITITRNNKDSLSVSLDSLLDF